MLYFVLKAWEFLAKKVSFLVEQAIKKDSSAVAKIYFEVLLFKGKRLKH
jgi:myo-inositol-1-phosphate synthase